MISLLVNYIMISFNKVSKQKTTITATKKTRGEGGKVRFPPFLHSHYVLRAHSISPSVPSSSRPGHHAG